MSRVYVSFEASAESIAIEQVLADGRITDHDRNLIQVVRATSDYEAAARLGVSQAFVRHRYLRAWDLVGDLVGREAAETYFQAKGFATD